VSYFCGRMFVVGCVRTVHIKTMAELVCEECKCSLLKHVRDITFELNCCCCVCWPGMTIARLNFSHGTYDYHRKSVENVREAESKSRRAIAIALDTKGPEIRTGLLSAGVNAEIELIAGEPVTVTIDDKYQEACDASIIWVDYKSIIKVVDVGKSIFIDDGLLSFIVQEKREDCLKVRDV